jgi:hypothetical protein
MDGGSTQDAEDCRFLLGTSSDICIATEQGRSIKPHVLARMLDDSRQAPEHTENPTSQALCLRPRESSVKPRLKTAFLSEVFHGSGSPREPPLAATSSSRDDVKLAAEWIGSPQSPEEIFTPCVKSMS